MKQPYACNTVLFDLDGTLIDTIADLAGATETVLSEYGVGTADGTPRYTYQQYCRFVGNGARKLVQRALGDGFTEQQVDAAYQRFLELYNANCMDKTAPYEGIVALLDSLKEKGVRLGVVTNKPEKQAQMLARHFFEPYNFICVYGSIETRPNKPDPTVVELALQNCDAERETTIFVGDSDVDVVTAHNAGLVCAGACWGFRGKEELQDAGAELLLEQPTDLLQYIL